MQQGVGGVLGGGERRVGVPQTRRGIPRRAEPAGTVRLGARLVRRVPQPSVQPPLQPPTLGRVGGDVLRTARGDVLDEELQELLVALPLDLFGAEAAQLDQLDHVGVEEPVLDTVQQLAGAYQQPLPARRCRRAFSARHSCSTR